MTVHDTCTQIVITRLLVRRDTCFINFYTRTSYWTNSVPTPKNAPGAFTGVPGPPPLWRMPTQLYLHNRKPVIGPGGTITVDKVLESIPPVFPKTGIKEPLVLRSLSRLEIRQRGVRPIGKLAIRANSAFAGVEELEFLPCTLRDYMSYGENEGGKRE